MKLEIVKQTENPLLERKEVTARVSEYDSTPSREALAEEIAKKTGGKKEGVHVVKVAQKYGGKSALLTAQVYASAESLSKHVHKKNLRLHKKEGAKK